MESFIESAEQLLAAFPSSTVLITYSNVGKKFPKGRPDHAPQNMVSFKVCHAHLGKNIRYSTYRTKEVSRLLTFLGPRGVSKKRKLDADAPEVVVGAAAIMANVKLEDEAETAAAAAATPVAEPAAPVEEPKKKKKKGKKK